MPRNAALLMLILSLFISLLFVIPADLTSATGQPNPIQQGNLGVHNVDSGKNYATIQEAISAPDTLAGNRITVASGTYYESLVVNKSVSLIGESRELTIIDGQGANRVVYVTASNVGIQGFTIQNGTFGLWLHGSNNSEIRDNILQDGSYGIRLLNSANTAVVGNIVRRYTFLGFEIDTSGNSRLHNNSIYDNRYNFGVNGKSLFDFANDIDTSNTVNGQPIRYLMNQSNLSMDASTYQGIGFLGIVNSVRVNIRSLEIRNNIEGVLLAFCANSTVTQGIFNNNWNGVYIAFSSNSSANHNEAHQNFDYGIKLFNSPRSQTVGNNVDDNGWAGIGIFGSPNSLVDQNEASYNRYDLHLVFTNNSVITQNTALLKPGGYSVAVYYSYNNLIYHNTLENTVIYVETKNRMQASARNFWDNGKEGNYWVGYRGFDVDKDGLSDTPRNVGENDIDNHPLMGKFHEFSIKLENEEFVVSVITNSTVPQLGFNVNNSTLSFVASGRNGTSGFLRIAVPNPLVEKTDDNLNFLVNGEMPVVKNKWTDDAYHYFYLVYSNAAAPEPTINLLPLLAILILVTITVPLLYIIFLRKKESRKGTNGRTKSANL